MVSEKSKLYGVDNVGQSTPTLTRTDSAIGLSVTVETSEIKSDFDRCYPWSDMYEVVDEHGNVFIRIPKFYTRITRNPNGTYKHQLSGYRYEGFTTLFVDGQGNEIDYVLVGKYEASGTSTKAESKSGKTVLVNVTLPQMRAACKANGEGYQQYDFLIDAIIKELFLIEMATTNSQSVMYGYLNSSNSAAIQTGRTDAVKTASGSEESNTDGQHACKYRGIENPYGNVWKWCDGITFANTKIYICLDPNHYVSEDTAAPYFYVGERLTSNGYLKEVSQFDKFPVLGFASSVTGGSDATYYCDYNYAYSGGTVLFVGGYWFVGGNGGLWSWNGYGDASSAYSFVGGRLCYKPL